MLNFSDQHYTCLKTEKMEFGQLPRINRKHGALSQGSAR
jgi:hypothetical protein